MIDFDLEPVTRDLPLTFNFCVPNAALIEERLQRLGWQKPTTKRRAKTRLSLLAEAVRASEAGQWISYSRWKNFYTGLTRYYGTGYSYRIVTDLVDQAVEHGLLEGIRAKKGEHRKPDPRQSRFRATQSLVEAFRDISVETQHHDLVRLRDAQGRLQAYTDDDHTLRIRAQCDAFNAYLATVTIQITANGLERQGRYIVVQKAGKAPCYIPEGPARLQRTFNRSRFDLGGRFYGWFQNLPKTIRSSIRLNGRPTVELDFAQLHATLLYAEKGIPMPMQDAYIVPGFTRDEGKLAFNVAINAPTTYKAIGAVQHELKVSRSDAATLIRAIKAAHPLIEDCFCSDQGVRLMSIDSEIMAAIMEQLKARAIPFLPVHDSLIVPQDERKTVKQIMIQQFEMVYPSMTIGVK